MKLLPKEAINFLSEKLISLGIPADNALRTAEVLVEAELRDDPSHGLSCLPAVLKSIKKGDIISNKSPETITEKNAMAVINGENVLGPVSGVTAVKLAMEKAKEHGIAAVSIRKSQHLYTLGYYTRMAALNNFVGILMTNTAPAMFAPGRLEKIIGTNPFSIGIPSINNPVVIDMSSTHVARGRIKEAAKKGEKIPTNWALSKEGKPTDNPDEALEGSLQPLGGYKGFALALGIDILSGILSGSASGKEVFGTSAHISNDDKDKKPSYKGDLFIAIDISKFSDLEEFKTRVFNLTKDISYIPGDKVHKNKDREIEIDDKLYEEISNL